MGEIEFLYFYLKFRVGIMLIEVDELLKLLLNSTLFSSTLILPHTEHIRFRLEDEKLSHLLNLGKFKLGTFDLVLIVLGHLIKGQ